MRNARYKTIPRATKKVAYGIARQRELIDLVEHRFAQAELLRYAVSRAHGSCDLATLAEGETPPIEPSTPAEAKGSAASEATAPAEAKGSAVSEATAPAEAKGSAPSEASTSAEAKGSAVSEATAPAEERSAVLSVVSGSEGGDEPLRSVTVIWHGKEETIDHPEVWLRIFADVSEAGDAITRELVRRRFRDEPYWKTCDALYLSHSAYYHNVREILHYALACAVGYGILDPRPPKQTAEIA